MSPAIGVSLLELIQKGTPKHTTRQTKAMTVNQDEVDLTVPAGKIWLVFWGYMKNSSGAGLTMGWRAYDENDDEIGIVFEKTVVNGEVMEIPYQEGTQDSDRFGHGAFPFLLTEGQYLQMIWGADAGKSGDSYWFMQILEFDKS